MKITQRFRNRTTLMLAAVGAAFLVLPTSSALPSAAGDDRRCWSAGVEKEKTSLGIHQWTLEQVSRWCAERQTGGWRIVSADRRASFETSTNWRLISKSGRTRKLDSGAVRATTRAHFRLRYPYFEQNCYPRLALTMWPSGAVDRRVRTGC